MKLAQLNNEEKRLYHQLRCGVTKGLRELVSRFINGVAPNCPECHPRPANSEARATGVQRDASETATALARHQRPSDGGVGFRGSAKDNGPLSIHSWATSAAPNIALDGSFAVRKKEGRAWRCYSRYLAVPLVMKGSWKMERSWRCVGSVQALGFLNP